MTDSLTKIEKELGLKGVRLIVFDSKIGCDQDMEKNIAKDGSDTFQWRNEGFSAICALKKQQQNRFFLTSAAHTR